METFDVEIPKSCRIYLIGDLHVGEPMFARDRFMEFWDKHIRDDRRAYVVGMGDWLSAIPPFDARHDARSVDARLPTISEARKWLLEFLTTWNKRFLWFHSGNHEEKVAVKYGDWLIKDTCEATGVKFGGYTAFVTLKPRGTDQTIEVITTHGSHSLNSSLEDAHDREANLKRRLRRLLVGLGEAEVYAMGHSHRLLVHHAPPDMRLKKIGDKVGHYYHQDKRWFLNTGSFLRTYVEGHTTYGERFGFRGLEMGCVVLEIKNGQIIACKEVVIE